MRFILFSAILLLFSACATSKSTPASANWVPVNKEVNRTADQAMHVCAQIPYTNSAELRDCMTSQGFKRIPESDKK